MSRVCISSNIKPTDKDEGIDFIMENNLGSHLLCNSSALDMSSVIIKTRSENFNFQ